MPGKNMRRFVDRPLIGWTIAAGMGCKSIDTLVVSTDDRDIADYSRSIGAEVIMRPPELASDTSPTFDAIEHVMRTLNANGEDTIVLLQPTSPLRTVEDIDSCLDLHRKGYRSVISVCVVDHNPYWTVRMSEKGFEPAFGWELFSKGRKDGFYCPNGAVYVISWKDLRETKTFYSEQSILYSMPKERGIDIDEELDFILAEFLASRNDPSVRT